MATLSLTLSRDGTSETTLYFMEDLCELLLRDYTARVEAGVPPSQAVMDARTVAKAMFVPSADTTPLVYNSSATITDLTVFSDVVSFQSSSPCDAPIPQTTGILTVLDTGSKVAGNFLLNGNYVEEGTVAVGGATCASGGSPIVYTPYLALTEGIHPPTIPNPAATLGYEAGNSITLRCSFFGSGEPIGDAEVAIAGPWEVSSYTAEYIDAFTCDTFPPELPPDPYTKGECVLDSGTVLVTHPIEFTMRVLCDLVNNTCSLSPESQAIISPNQLYAPTVWIPPDSVLRLDSALEFYKEVNGISAFYLLYYQGGVTPFMLVPPDSPFYATDGWKGGDIVMGENDALLTMGNFSANYYPTEDGSYITSTANLVFEFDYSNYPQTCLLPPEGGGGGEPVDPPEPPQRPRVSSTGVMHVQFYNSYRLKPAGSNTTRQQQSIVLQS